MLEASSVIPCQKPMRRRSVWEFINVVFCLLYRIFSILLILIFLILSGGMLVQPVAIAQAGPSVVGQWSAVIQWPHDSIHMSVLPNGKVLTWPLAASDYPYIWEPSSGVFTAVSQAPFELFCGGHSFLSDGRLFVDGGGPGSGDTDNNIAFASVYNPVGDIWQSVPPMNAARYYPTNTTLPNGNVLVISGNISGTVGRNELPQVFNPSTWSWQDLTDAQKWLPMYPWMFVAPNGKVFMAGPYPETKYIDTAGNGLWTDVALRNVSRREGSAVMYDTGKILVIGGSPSITTRTSPVATAEVIDLNAPSPAWRYVGSMSKKRQYANLTLLPDGKALVTGGTSGKSPNNITNAVYSAEMWDPQTEKFTTMASMVEPRLYHSTAALLPDGRVIAAGGNYRPTAELYSPPYLFKGSRPTITSAPSSVAYGKTFFVETPNAASISKVTWIRLSSVTHSFNMDQRINRLSFSQTAGGLNITAPSDKNLCPPGHYMLFILNGNGVPSVAKIIHIG